MIRRKSPLSNVKAWTDRHGKRRHAFRVKGRKLVPLKGAYGSPEFMTAYQVAYYNAFGGPAPASLAVVPKTIRRPDPSNTETIDWLVSQFLKSDKFKTYSPETQQGRARTLERFRADHGDKPFADMMPQHIIALMDEIKGGAHPKRNWLKHISGLFLYAEENRIRIDNPCRGFKRPTPPRTKGFHTWSDPEIAKYRAYWPNGTVPRLVMELAVETSARRGDTVRLGPEQMRNGRFEFQHNKNGVDVSIPVSDELQQAIDAMPKSNHRTFLVTREGEPRSAKSLGGDFRTWCDKAGLPKHCGMHGLRKGCLRILAEAGCDILELQSRGGHRTLSELAKYVEEANKALAADRAAEKVKEHRAKAAKAA